MDVDKDKPATIEMERGHSANSVLEKPNDELWEEFVEIPHAITHAEHTEDEN
jgi:hypothetical protein